MRRLIFAIAGLIAVSLAGLMWTVQSPTRVLTAVDWLLATFTDVRLDMRNPQLDLYNGTFSADELHLLPASGDGPPLVSLLDLAATLPPRQLLSGVVSGSSLYAQSLAIYVSDQESTAPPAPTQWLGYLGWLPANLYLGQVHLITASANTWIFPLKAVRGERRGTGDYKAFAAAGYQGEPLDIELDVFDLRHSWGQTSARARAVVQAPESGSLIEVEGEIEGNSEAFRYDVSVEAFYRDISEFLKGFEGGKDLAGTLRLNGRLNGDAAGFVLSQAHFVLDNMPEYGFEADGELTYQWSGDSTIDLAANGELASVDYLLNWLDLDIRGLGRASSSARLTGSLDRPVLEDFRVVTGNDAGLTLSLQGSLQLYEVDPGEAAQDNAVFFDVQGPSLTVLKDWIGELPYDPGVWRAGGRIRGTQRAFALDQLVIETGTPAGVQLRASGKVANIAIPTEGEPSDLGVKGVDLELTGHVPDSAQLGTLLNLELPPYQEINASLALSGDRDTLQLSAGRIEVTASDLQASMDQIRATFHPTGEKPLTDLSAALQLQLSDTSALSQYSTLEVPVLGPVHVTANLAQQGPAYQLRNVVGTITSSEFNFELRGEVDDLVTLGGTSLRGRFSGMDTGQMMQILLPRFDYRKNPGMLDGAFRLTQSEGQWQLSELSLDGGSANGPMQLSASGTIGNLTGVPEPDLQARLVLTDPALLQALTSLPLNPLTARLDLNSSAVGILGTLTTDIGRNRLRASSVIALQEGVIQSLQFSLDTPHLFLQDLFNLQQSLVAGPATGAAEQPEPLEQLRQSPPPFPIDAAVIIGGISGDNTHIDRFSLRVTGIDHRYTLEDFSAVYGNALAELRGIVDLQARPAAVSLAGDAIALPLSAILQDVGVKTNVSGALTVRGGVTLTGDSPPQLLGNLNGSVAVALEDAVIEGAAYDLLATDLLAWIYSGAMAEKSTYIDCVMARFQFRQGVASTDSLYIESSKMVATGRAEFDLVNSRLDVRITPMSKSRTLQVPSEVRLKGKMSDPKASISAVNAVADAATAAITLIPDLTMKLFGISRDSSRRPCAAELED